MIESNCQCGLAGWGVVRIPWEEIPRRRKDPGPAPGLTPAPHLKLADEQTVVGAAAVLDACVRAGRAPTGFSDWAVLAAPRYIGRARLAPGFRRFGKMGARGVSPLIIPTMSNHAMAGTICLMLGSHGPNFGVGGSTPFVDELFLNALSLFEGQHCPGVWAVITAWDPEPIPDGDGDTLAPTFGVGVALALVPDASGGAIQFVMRLTDSATTRGTVFELADYLERPSDTGPWRCPILGGGYLELTPGSAASLPLAKAA